MPVYSSLGRRVVEIFGSLFWSKTMIELIFDLCGEFRWSPEGTVSQIHSPQFHVGIFSELLKSVQMPKRKWGAEINGKLSHLFIPSKTATLVIVFAVEDLPVGRTATLVMSLQWKTCPCAEHSWWWWFVVGGKVVGVVIFCYNLLCG